MCSQVRLPVRAAARLMISVMAFLLRDPLIPDRTVFSSQRDQRLRAAHPPLA
jgi:hypothetical protein